MIQGMRMYLSVAVLILAISSAKLLSNSFSSNSGLDTLTQFFKDLHIPIHESEPVSVGPVSFSADEVRGRAPLKEIFSGYIANSELRNRELLILETGDGNEEFVPFLPTGECLIVGTPCSAVEQREYSTFYTYTSPGTFTARLYFESNCRFPTHDSRQSHVQCDSTNKRLLGTTTVTVEAAPMGP
jgi:hypothetical protein